MSETAKRDAVLEEFAHDAGVHRVWGVAGMADEIVCLRSANKDLTDHYADARAEIDRLRRILAALREPSEKITDALFGEYWDTADVRNAFRVAVAAAEREVDA